MFFFGNPIFYAGLHYVSSKPPNPTSLLLSFTGKANAAVTAMREGYSALAYQQYVLVYVHVYSTQSKISAALLTLTITI